jgi:radial spoke head protein 4/6
MSVANLQSLDAIRAQLRKEKDLGEHVKSDLYSHLTEVFTRIM